MKIRYYIIFLLCVSIFSIITHAEATSQNKSTLIGNHPKGQQGIPQLIPLSAEDKIESLHLNINGLDSTLTVHISVRVQFDGDLSDTTHSISPTKVNLKMVRFPDGQMISMYQKINPKYKFLWKQIEDKFVNWMFAQPFNEYYNRTKRSTLHEQVPVTVLSFDYKVVLHPNNEK